MHRALLIELGESFEAPFARLRERLKHRMERGVVAFFDAPVVGDGNLSRPVESLKRSLDDELSEILSGLLTLTNDAHSEILLDVFICANAGERRTIEAMEEVVETLLELIVRDYGAVFPSHREGLQRGLRLFPLIVLPHGRSSERPRDEAVAAAATFAGGCDALFDGERESPIDRIFILDGVTSRGVASPHALTAQAEAFLMVAANPDFRRGALLTDALDRPCAHRMAALGAASFQLPLSELHREVAGRVCDELLESLRMLPRDAMRLPSPEQLVPSFAVLRDEALERAIEQLEDHIPRAVERYGLPGVEGAVADLAEVEKRLAAWRSAGIARQGSDEEPSEIATVEQDDSTRAFAVAGSLAFGVLMVVLAHFVFGLALAASAGISAFFALAALGIALLLVSVSENKAKRALEVDRAERRRLEAPADDALTPDQRLDLLTSTAASCRMSGRSLVDSLAALRPDVPRLQPQGLRPWSWSASVDRLAPVVHDAIRDYSDSDELRRSFEASIPPLAALLDGTEVIEATDLEVHALSRTSAALDPAIQRHHAVRETVLLDLEEFIDAWEHGIEPFVDLARDRHFESATRIPVRNALFADPHVAPSLDELASNREGPFQKTSHSDQFRDVVLLSIRCDLPIGSLAAFSPHFEEEAP